MASPTGTSGREILVQLLERTPLPSPSADVEQLLSGFEAMVAERAVILELITPPLTLGEEDRALLVELEHREAAWQAALTAAQKLVGEQRRGAEQLRAYARTI